MNFKDIHDMILRVQDGKASAEELEAMRTVALLAIAAQLMVITEVLPGAGRGY